MPGTTEFDVIKDYFTFGLQRDDVELGVGDDCAIVMPPAECRLAVTVDTLVSGVHFPLDTSPADIAYKSLAVNLSDLAAMGAQPAWVTLALTLPEIRTEWLSAFAESFQQTCREYGVQLIGGDTTRGPLAITVQATGFVYQGRIMQRNAAKPGDRIYVTGTLGDAALGLGFLSADKVRMKANYESCINKLNRPVPRVLFGQAAAEFCRCAIDISDGLLADLGHILETSACGAEIYLENIPLSTELKAFYAGDGAGDKTINWKTVLAGGDDYELCLVASGDNETALMKIAQQQSMTLTCIGNITESDSLMVIDSKGKLYEITDKGYDHFS